MTSKHYIFHCRVHMWIWYHSIVAICGTAAKHLSAALPQRMCAAQPRRMCARVRRCRNVCGVIEYLCVVIVFVCSLDQAAAHLTSPFVLEASVRRHGGPAHGRLPALDGPVSLGARSAGVPRAG